MNWPVILSGVVSLATLALGFDLLLPLASGLEPVCLSLWSFSALWKAHSGIVKTPGTAQLLERDCADSV